MSVEQKKQTKVVFKLIFHDRIEYYIAKNQFIIDENIRKEESTTDLLNTKGIKRISEEKAIKIIIENEKIENNKI